MPGLTTSSEVCPESGSDFGGHDLLAVERAAADFMRALGLDIERETARRSPARMARAWAELLTPRPFDMTTFPNDHGYDGLVLVRDLPVAALCEHHLLPFVGVAHVGYLPGDRLLGLSKLARVVEWFARRPQIQERLTRQIAGWLNDQVEPHGVAVLIAAQHTCISVRGACATGSTTITSAMTGRLRHVPCAREEFLTLAGMLPFGHNTSGGLGTSLHSQ